MQFKHVLLVATAFALSAIATPVPDSSLSCSDPKHPCKTYNTFPDCSADYIATLTQCESSGCVRWVMDPLEHCNCDSPLHACNTYIKYEVCSPQYIADVKECKYTGCLQWFRDPLEDCKGYY